jgi:CRISPR/Cas system Type II protein with McrA/HNH and RuvC-like nuclease domain
MECRGCKGAINAILNPQRTSQQLFESSVRRRIGDMLLQDKNEVISINNLFERFDHRCFKTKEHLDIKDRGSWAIDHILPSKYLYPLTVANAALLSKEANDNKRDRWPSEFYKNNELVKLAKITGADLNLLSSKEPIINPNIDVDACVTRALSVREQSNLWKRISELKKMLISYGLIDKLSDKNKRLLGYKTKS